MFAPSLVLTASLVSLVSGQMPTYLSTRSFYPGISSSGISSSTLQALLTKQLLSSMSSPSSSPKRSLVTSSSRYGLPAASNPSIVAIPLYVRNSAGQSTIIPKSRSIYDMLADRKMSASSTKYLTYAPKRVVSAPAMDVPISYQSEPSAVRYTTAYRQYEAPAPKAAPAPASSSYEPVRSYELKNTEPGYGDASSVSLLSGGGYTSGPSGQGSLSISYAQQAQSAPQTSAYRQLAGQIAPRLKAVEYDDSQKSALADFASALENFELKSITNQDIYDIPVINPPLTRIPVKPKAVAAAQTDSDGGYGGPKPTYAAPPSAAASSYDDAPRSYAPAPSSSSSYASSASADYSERPSESYRPSSSYGGSSSSYDRGSSSESYRASGTDSYGSSAVYVPPPPSYESSVSSESSYKPSSSYSSASASDYYSQGSAPVPNPDDPNCPYRNQGAAAGDYSASSSSSASSYVSSSSSPKSKNVESSSYEADELDPSKLELKIVHLPVSVLKRLVGSGDLALPSFNKKK